MASEQILRAVVAAMHGGKGSGKGKGSGRILGFVDEPHFAGAVAHGFVPIASCDVIVADDCGSGGSGRSGGSGGPGSAASLVTQGSTHLTHHVLGVVCSCSSSGEVCGTSCNWDNFADEEAAEVEDAAASDDAADAAYSDFFAAMDTENAVRPVRGLLAKDEQDEEEMEEGEEGEEESSEESSSYTSFSEEVLGEECEESGISWPGSADYEFILSGGAVVGAVPKVKAKGKGKVKGTGKGKTKVKGKGKAKAKTKAKVVKPTKSKKSRPHGL
jgi:hypothetical protein